MFHPEYVERLPFTVLSSHIDDAFEPEEGTDCGGGYPVLPGARLRNDSLLLHAKGQQALAEAVVDLVRAGVEQIFTLQVNLGAAEFLRHAGREGQGRGSACVFREVVVQFLLELRVGPGLLEFAVEFFQGRHQGLRHKTAAVGAEMPLVVRVRLLDRRGGHHAPFR